MRRNKTKNRGAAEKLTQGVRTKKGEKCGTAFWERSGEDQNLNATWKSRKRDAMLGLGERKGE